MNTFEKIYAVVKRIPKGKVSTYGQIARLAGNPHWSRVVGYALHSNPDPADIPCHRVLNRFGEACPSYVFGGDSVQRGILETEGVAFGFDGCVDLATFGWDGYESASEATEVLQP
jgi:methylated-DNA-protein-cysteine methyltransferase-like protein